MIRSGYILAISCCVLLSSCMKEEDPVQLPPSQGNLQNEEISMGSDYSQIVFFDLGSGKKTAANIHDWDLALDADPTGKHIWVNGGNNALAALTNKKKMDQVTDLSTLTWAWDSPTGHEDSTAVGNWFNPGNGNSYKNVYVLDRGLLAPANNRYWKFIVLEATADHYTFVFQKWISQPNDTLLLEVPKADNKSRIYIDFSSGSPQVKQLEPQKQDWDIVFTRYRYIYNDMNPKVPYQVVGVLLNPEGTKAILDSTVNFETLDYAKASTYSLQSAQDIIGFGWKAYDFSKGIYYAKKEFVYILQDADGIYYKLRFYDFYDNQGAKGTPKFEYQRL